MTEPTGPEDLTDEQIRQHERDLKNVVVGLLGYAGKVTVDDILAGDWDVVRHDGVFELVRPDGELIASLPFQVVMAAMALLRVEREQTRFARQRDNSKSTRSLIN